MIVTTAQLFKVAYGRFAVGAYNINNLEQCVGLFKGSLQMFKGSGRLQVTSVWSGITRGWSVVCRAVSLQILWAPSTTLTG